MDKILHLKKRKTTTLVNLVLNGFLVLNFVGCIKFDTSLKRKEKLSPGKYQELIKKNGYVLDTIDEDEDGVRDDINKLVLEKCPDEPMKQACYLYAKNLYHLMFAKTVEDKKKFFTKRIKLENCMIFLQTDKERAADYFFSYHFSQKVQEDEEEGKRMGDVSGEMLRRRSEIVSLTGGFLEAARSCPFYISDMQKRLVHKLQNENGDLDEAIKDKINEIVNWNRHFNK